jgi:hypothetical protein
MSPKTSAKSVRTRVQRKAAKALPVRTRKIAREAARNGGLHLGRVALLAGIAAAAAASAFAFLPDSVSGEVRKQIKDTSKVARASVSDAEKLMKQAIEAARSYASNALH